MSNVVHFLEEKPLKRKLSKIDTKSQGFGRWYYDKKTKKRRYIALTGRVFTGMEAISRARQDSNSSSNPAIKIRFELHYLTLKADQSFLRSQDSISLSNLSTWGLPPAVVERYRKKRVNTLFQWQIDCLLGSEGAVLNGQNNLIYSAPTSGGKTLVSEILMLRKIAEFNHNKEKNEDIVEQKVNERKRKTIFFVVPFVALAEEKTNYFQEMWQDMNVGIKAFHGDEGNGTGNVLTEDVEVAVCTIERANILLTQLLNDGNEDQLMMIVIDEIHMLSDSHRGFLLEVMLSKVKYLFWDKIQIIGMSATLPNIEHLANWVDAILYKTDFRPVELQVKLCLDRRLYDVLPTKTKNNKLMANNEIADEKIVDKNTLKTFEIKEKSKDLLENCEDIFEFDRELRNSAKLGINKNTFIEDEEGVKQLCVETISNEKSVLLFCNSKKRCEANAKNMSEVLGLIIRAKNGLNPDSQGSFLSLTGLSKASEISGFLSSEVVLRAQANLEKFRPARLALVESLSQTQVGLCPILAGSVLFGVAYHHAGLTLDERKLLEQGFRTGLIQVLCTTSTLSAGVNLPAHRVIIRSPKMGDSFISVASFRQMCGRAGRMGMNEKGEAILMIKNERVEKERAAFLLTQPLDPLFSSLHQGYGGGLEKLLLEMISCGRLTVESEVMQFINCTLLSVQQEYSLVLNYTKEALLFLKKEQFVLTSNTGNLTPSPLGIATTLSGISPRDATQILKPLLQAQKKLILKGGLHPVFLVTPPTSGIEPDWNNYEKVLHVLFREHPEAKEVAQYLGIELNLVCQFAFRNPSHGSKEPQVLLYKRFYSSILLFTLIQEWPMNSVTKLTHNVTRGQLQQLQKDAGVFCGMTSVFCRKLNWTLLAACLEDFAPRLSYGAQRDILPLVRLGTEITTLRARAMIKNGIASAQDILQCEINQLATILQEHLPYDSSNPIEASGNTINHNSVTISDKKDSQFSACFRLAQRIVYRAKLAVKQEVARLNSK